jgi:ribosome-binding factor A
MSLKRYRPSKKVPLTDLCTQPGDDDGIDPRKLSRAASSRKDQLDRKTLQLCSQVAHVIESVLTSELGDEDLAALRVVSVAPLSHGGRLLVTVAPGIVDATPATEVVLSKLQSRYPRIRAEVGAAITRRKTPELQFSYVPCLPMEQPHA